LANNDAYSQREPYPRDVTEIAHLLSQSFDKDIIIRKVLAHINRRLGKRARYCAYKDSKLVIQCCVGEYRERVEPGKEIVRESVVWKAFEEGKALNFIHPSQSNGYQHTLQEQVKIKAAVPLIYVDPRTQQEMKFGMLVIDSGKKGTPIPTSRFACQKTLPKIKTGLQVIKSLHDFIQRKRDLKMEIPIQSSYVQEILIPIVPYLSI
jgi:hypothetical protein